MSDTQQPTGTALTASQQFNQQIEEQAKNFAIMLPQHISLEKFKRVVVTAVIQEPKLFTADRKSLFIAAQKCASDGLLPDGREAVLLPFNTTVKRTLPDGTRQDARVDLVQYIPMVQGIRTRMRNTGLVASSEAYVVYRNDKFFQKFGSDPQIAHEPPALGTPRGDPVGAYAIIRLTSGEVIQEVMDRDEIERIRSFSKAKDGPAWKNHWGEMARKSVLRRAAKSAPTSAEMLTLLERDDEQPDTADSMVDITGANYEPEPARDTHGATTTEAEISYAVIDADGEEHEYTTAAGACQAIGLVFKDAARRGPVHLRGAAESNMQMLQTLRQDGHGALVDEIVELFHEMQRKADPFAGKPQEQSPADDQPERDAAGIAGPDAGGAPEPGPEVAPGPQNDRGAAETPVEQRGDTGAGDLLGGKPTENLTVPMSKNPGIGDLSYYQRQMLAMIAEQPGDLKRLAQIKKVNDSGIQALKANASALYDEVMAAMTAARSGKPM